VDGPEVAHKLLGVGGVELRGMADMTAVEKAKQVVGGGAVALDRLNGRAQHQFVVAEPAAAQFGNPEGLEKAVASAMASLRQFKKSVVGRVRQWFHQFRELFLLCKYEAGRSVLP
jgi:hypothetical protein